MLKLFSTNFTFDLFEFPLGVLCLLNCFSNCVPLFLPCCLKAQAKEDIPASKVESIRLLLLHLLNSCIQKKYITFIYHDCLCKNDVGIIVGQSNIE